MSSKSRYTSGAYLRSNPTWHSEDSGWKTDQVWRLLIDNHVEFSSCVEIGCGSGHVIAGIAHKHPKARFVGYDISPQAELQWPKDTSVVFELGDAAESDERFDIGLMIDVFEHVEDYLGFLRSCAHLATYFVFHIPLELHLTAILRDQQMKTREEVGHLHYFSRATALATLRDAGYRIVDERYTAGALELESARTRATRIANPLRRALWAIEPTLVVKLLGGYSLLVLAQADTKGGQ